MLFKACAGEPVIQLARPRPPLMVTGLTLALLLAGPSWWLWRTPRLHAAGLERLAASAALLQSFRSGGLLTPPALWSQRLGPGLAQQLWARHSGLWWQFWGGHGDGAEFLVLPAEAFAGVSPLPLPPRALQVDDLVVLAADPLNRQWLQDQLRLKFAPPQGQQRQCINQLKSSESVYWSGPTLGELLGPLTPLFLPFQQGCLVFAGEGKALSWQGQASSLGPSPAGPQAAAPLLEPPARQDVDALLLLQGGQLAPLVDGLLDSRLVREPLQKSYGLGPAQLGLLRQAPFELRLRSQAQGPYRASLELHLALGAKASDWRALLAGLRKGLLAQGLEEKEASAQWQRQGMGQPFSDSTWQRDDGSSAGGTSLPSTSLPSASLPSTSAPSTAPQSNAAPTTTATSSIPISTVVGGWRWLNRAPGASQGAAGSAQPRELLLFLGPEPKPNQARAPQGAAWDPARAGTLSLWAQPQALDRLGLWPPGVPPLLKRSRSLRIGARALAAGGWSLGSGASQLSGRLELP